MERLKPGRNNPVGITTRSNHKWKRLRRAARVEETVWDDPHAVVTRSEWAREQEPREVRFPVSIGTSIIARTRTRAQPSPVVGTDKKRKRERGKKEEQHKNTRKGDNLGHIFNGTSKLQPEEEEEPTKPAAHDRAGQALRGQKKKEDLSAERVLTHQKRSITVRFGKDQRRHPLGVFGVGSFFWLLRLVLPSSRWV